MSKNKTITAENIKEIIFKTAVYLKERKEIADKALELENELKTLEESYQGMTGSFGFSSPESASNKSKTGFKNDFYFARLSELGAEIQSEMQKQNQDNVLNEDLIDEVKKLKSENEALKKENENLKK